MPHQTGVDTGFGLHAELMEPDPRHKVGEEQVDDQTLRLYFAGERTLLSWVRTGIAMIGLGFVIARFGVDLPRVTVWFGTGVVVMGVAVSALSGLQYYQLAQHIQRGEPLPFPHWLVGVILAAAMSLFGLVTAIYLILVAEQPL